MLRNVSSPAQSRFKTHLSACRSGCGADHERGAPAARGRACPCQQHDACRGPDLDGHHAPEAPRAQSCPVAPPLEGPAAGEQARVSGSRRHRAAQQRAAVQCSLGLRCADCINTGQDRRVLLQSNFRAVQRYSGWKASCHLVGTLFGSRPQRLLLCTASHIACLTQGNTLRSIDVKLSEGDSKSRL